MKLPEPTTLHHGLETAMPEPASSGLAWLAVLLPVIFLLCWYTHLRVRRARRHPEEQAFLSLARRMRLGTRQIHAVREYANRNAFNRPIVVLMTTELLNDALSVPHKPQQ